MDYRLKWDGVVTSSSPVDELIDDNNVSRLNLLTQGATGCGNQQMCTTLFSKSPDVGLVVHIGRHYSVLSSMSEDMAVERAAFNKCI